MNYILEANYPYLRPQTLHQGDNCSKSMMHPHVLAYGGIRLLPAKEQQLPGDGYESGDVDWLYSLRVKPQNLVGNPTIGTEIPPSEMKSVVLERKLAIGQCRHLFTVNDNWLVSVWNDFHVGIVVRNMVFFLCRLVFDFMEENRWFRTVIFFPDAGGVVRGECEKDALGRHFRAVVGEDEALRREGAGE
ncbi:hypothetical protein B0H16DRAFT_1532906 [Mycena metata]|uniref:Uncharacterized protein n=1 Tax=Mycena metata TaxID=1033252 RepID=A0AAD7J967_9AGAR|nr:hypothetical protein B0H16DRAFT_1532906 [Mycena metata]